MTSPVFFASPSELAYLQPGDSFILGGQEGHHARTVKRLSAGGSADIVDGAGRRVHGLVRDDGGAALSVEVAGVFDEPISVPALTLVQALAKGGRDELAIEAATELGIDAVVPWQAERSIVRWKMDKAVKGRNKWESTVTAAAKQARRARIPQVRPSVGATGLAELAATASLTLVLHEDAETSITSLLTTPGIRALLRPEETVLKAGQRQTSSRADTPPREIPEIVLVVGPEGGISSQETTALTRAAAVPVRLGAHVLRSSTAGPAAIAILNQSLGRWD